MNKFYYCYYYYYYYYYYLFDPNFSYRRILDIHQNNSIQNLSRLILKTNELQGVGEKHPRTTLAEKPGMSRVNLAMRVRPTGPLV